MELKLYNTLTRKKEVFEPLDPKNVRMYVCGPTVYDFAHIGNARPVIVFDVLFRLLRHIYGEKHVTYVRNITDIDDKINARAAEEGVSIRELTDRTGEQYQRDVAALGCLEPTYQPRATDHIKEMKEIIELLGDSDHAYVANEHVLFDVSSMKDYGRLSNRPLEEMIAGARVEVAPYKKNPMDFVLWKPSDKRSNTPLPSWPSPLKIETEGRPGWHIECSAMAWRYLAEVFDIHGGGIDLVFPHHENEIAQSRCAFHTSQMARYWMHNGFLQVEGEKMSKSLGNFVTIDELLRGEKFGAHTWHGGVLRLAMLKTHYTKPIDWTLDLLRQSRQEMSTFQEAASRGIAAARLAAELALGHRFEPDQRIVDILSNDLDTPGVVARLHELAANVDGQASAMQFLFDLSFLGLMSHRDVGTYVSIGAISDIAIAPILYRHDYFTAVEGIRVAQANDDPQALDRWKREIESWGVRVSLRKALGDISLEAPDNDETQRLRKKAEIAIEARNAARKAKNFKEADRIRDELDAMGVVLKDGPQGTTWELKR